MRLLLKTLIFAVLGFFGAVFLTVPAAFVSSVLSDVVYHVVWIGFIAYPTFEHFFILKKRHDDIDENSRIKAYIRYIKSRKFTNYIRFVAAFVLSLGLTIILSIIGYHLDLQGDGDESPAKLALCIFIIGWLGFYQVVKFGLHKSLALTKDDEALISIEEYNKIEYEIIRLNSQRRIAVFLLIMQALALLYGLSIINQTITAVFGLFILLISALFVNGWLKNRFKKRIFPHINELKDLSFGQHDIDMDIRHDHPIIGEYLEKMHTDTHFTHEGKEGKKQFQLWERMDGLKTYLVISVRLKNIADTPVYLSTDNIGRKVKRSEISNSTHQFGSIFRIFSDDNVLAYKFMTPVVQENFLKLAANANAFDFNCSVQENEMVIVMKCGSDLFEVGSLFEKVTLNKINNAIAEIRLAKSLPDLLSF